MRNKFYFQNKTSLNPSEHQQTEQQQQQQQNDDDKNK